MSQFIVKDVDDANKKIETVLSSIADEFGSKEAEDVDVMKEGCVNLGSDEAGVHCVGDVVVTVDEMVEKVMDNKVDDGCDDVSKVSTDAGNVPHVARVSTDSGDVPHVVRVSNDDDAENVCVDASANDDDDDDDNVDSYMVVATEKKHIEVKGADLNVLCKADDTCLGNKSEVECERPPNVDIEKIDGDKRELLKEQNQELELSVEDEFECLTQWWDKNAEFVINEVDFQLSNRKTVIGSDSSSKLKKDIAFSKDELPTFHLLSQEDSQPVPKSVVEVHKNEKDVVIHSPKTAQSVPQKRKVNPSAVLKSPYLNKISGVLDRLTGSEYALSTYVFSSLGEPL